MDTDDQRRNRKQKETKARQIVSERLHRFYGNLLSGLEADADEFFRRVMQQQDARERRDAGSRP